MNRPFECRVVVEPLEHGPDIAVAIAEFAGKNEPAILDTSLPDRFSRFSVFACEPVQTFEVDVFTSDPIRTLAECLFPANPAIVCPQGLPFAGGWIGYFAYESGLHGAAGDLVPQRRNFDLPLCRFSLYDSAALYDHTTGQWQLVAVDWPAGATISRPSARQRLTDLQSMLAAASRRAKPTSTSTRSKKAEVRPDSSRESYVQRFRRVQEYIAAGDVYQVNLAARFLARTSHSPGELFLRLRQASPAPFSALLSWGDRAIVSSSPELFLTLRDEHVITRPIKGTRPRGSDAVLDQVQRAGLAASEKEQAELNMIVDLMRNDLGRVCRFGSVRVSSAGELEAHPTLHHRVATVEGDMRDDCSWSTLLAAAFPGGSVTGAPKIRAMQIISELEPFPRGVYCGAIGWIGLDGGLSLNLAIRTMFQYGRRVELFAGSGIVADSIAEQEYDEILIKLAGMQEALGGRLAASGAPEVGAA